MNALQLIHFTCVISYLYLAAYIIIKNHKSLLNLSCSAVILTFCHWSFSLIFVHDPSVSKETASLFYNIGSFAWASFASVALWFVMVFIDNKTVLKSKLFYLALVVPPVLVIYGQWTGSVAADYVPQPWGWAFVWSNSFWTYLFYTYYLVYMTWGIYLIIRQASKMDDPVKKKQAKIICYAAVFPLIFSTSTDVVLPNMRIHVIPNMAPDFTIIWVFGVVVAIVKYRMLELTPSLAAEKIVSAMSDSLLLLDKDGKITLTNTSAENLLGYRKNEIEGKTVATLFPGSLREEQMNLLGKGGGVVSYDYVLTSKDGEEIPVLLSSSVMRGTADEIIGISCIVRDITERKQAEELLKEERNQLDRMVRERTGELQKSEEKYRLLFSNMNEGVALHSIVLDRDGEPIDYIITDVNRSYERLVGIKRNDAIGNKASDLYGLGEQPYLDVYSKVAESGRPHTFEAYFPSLDKHFYISVFSPSKGLFATMFSDVTKRKRSEEALRKTTRALKTLIGCNEAVVRAKDENDLLNSVCKIIVDAGGYRLAWIGFAEDDELKTIRPVAQSGHEEGYLESANITWAERELGRCPVGTAIRTRNVCVSQDIHTDPNFAPWKEEAAKRGYASCAAFPLVDGDKAFGALAIYAIEKNAFDPDELELLLEMAGDVSYGIKALRTSEEKRKAEEEKERFRSQLVQADKMTTFGQLASGVAHEINNPAAFVISNLGILKENCAIMKDVISMYSHKRPEAEIERFWRGSDMDMVLEDVPDMLSECQEGMERIKGTTKELRQFSRVDDEMASSVQLQDLVESSLTIASNTIKYRAKVVRRYSDIPDILANRGKMSQVFLNIIINAAQAIEEGHVGANWIRVATGREGNRIHVEIANSGEPIPPEIMSRIFNPFFTTKPQGQGTGLGLSICYSIVQQHGGHIEVESSADRGTVFHIWLPLDTGHKVRTKFSRDAVPKATRPGRVLVIDDEEGILNSVRRTLRVHEVVTARGGQQALEIIAERQDFDVVLCDLVMPEITGMEVYEKVSSEYPILAKRFVFLTGGAFTPRAMDFVNKVENKKYDKPLDNKTLLEIVEKAIWKEDGEGQTDHVIEQLKRP